MTKGSLSIYPRRDVSMARSNPAALKGIVGHSLSHLEMPSEPSVDHYLQTALHYQSHADRPESDTATPTPNHHRSHAGVVQGWSDTTLTGMHSGQFSVYSWGMEEGEFDRAATEKVGRMFDRINAVLYDGRSSGSQPLDKECGEWRTTFPHLEVQGEHLLDAMDDGTEVVAPLDCLLSSQNSEREDAEGGSGPLTVVGKRIQPVVLSDSPENDALREEVIAVDGTLEEYFAFDNTDEHQTERKRRSRLGHAHSLHLPPVTPSACVREAVCGQVFDLIWSEVAAILQPLVSATRDRVIKERSSSYSLHGSLTSHGSSPLGLGPLQHEPYILPGLRNQPALTRAIGQSGSQYLRLKPSTGSLATPLLPQLPQPSALTGVMQIKSVSLRQRMPSIAMVSHGEHEDIPSRLSIHHNHHQPAESAGLTNGRLGRHNLSLLPRPSDYQLPPTPGNRLLSGRLPSRRNVLRPIEKPKTPALVPIDDGIRGYKLYASANQGSPPPTPYVRNTQLPPLELGSGVSSVGLSSALSSSGPSERSPPVVRGKMLSSRNVSAVSDLQESRRSQYHGRGSGADLRPNTTTSTFRAESGKLGRKVSEHGSFPHGAMKVVGHATGVGHYSAGMDYTTSGLRERGVAMGMGVGGSIAEGEEGEEEEEGDAVGLNITGYSGFLQSKPKADSRGKLRGHVR